MPKFVSNILAKAGLIVDGVVALNNTATGQTPDANDNSTKLVTTAWVRTYVAGAASSYTLPIASASTLGGIKVGTGLSISGTGVLSASGSALADVRTVQTFTATANQTTITVANGYVPGLIAVFVNGVFINEAQYTANGTTIVFNEALALNDIVDVEITSPFYTGQLPDTRQEYLYTATAGQTVFTANYIVGQLDIFYNGSKISSANYTANNGTSVTLGFAASAGDIVEIHAWYNGLGISATSFSATAPILYNSGTKVFSLATSGATAGSYGSSSAIPTITVDAYGRITSISTAAVQIVSSLSGLTDVALSSVTNNDLLRYNSSTSKWQNIPGSTYALDANVVHITGNETITGIKVFNANTGFGSAAANPKAELQMGARTAFFTTSSINTNLGNNVYYDGTNFRRIAADNDAPLVQLHSDGYIGYFFQSDVLTAADSVITYSEKFRFTKNGRLLVNTGVESTYNLDVNGTSRFVNASTQDSSGTSESLTSANWTSTGWTGDFATGFTHTTGNTSALSHTFSIAGNNWIVLILTITNRTAGSVTVGIGGVTVGPFTATTTQGIRGVSAGNLVVTPTSDFNGTVQVSVRSAGSVAASSSWATSNGTVRLEIRALSNTNTLIGDDAGSRMYAAASGGNTFIGQQAGAYLVVGSSNTIVGSGAGQYLTHGTNNTFLGANTGLSAYNTTNSIYVGPAAGYGVTGGTHNIYMGTSTGYNNTTGSYNIAIGGGAATTATSADYNVLLGYQVLTNATTITNTIALGYLAGGSATLTATNSIFLGHSARANADAQTNQIVIGYNIAGLGSNTTAIGNASTTLTALYGSTIINGTSIQASAVLQADSTTKGFLPPRMIEAQRTAITTPATGLVVYQTDGTEGLYIKLASGWKALAIV